MLIDWIAAASPLADTDTHILTSLFSNIVLWGRVALGIGLVIFVHELGSLRRRKNIWREV